MFFPWLRRKIQQNDTILCLGLDPPLGLTEDLVGFGSRMLDAAARMVCCCKPNIAFYEARGEAGWAALREIIRRAHGADLPVILDCKRGDVGSTAEAYAHAAYDVLDADAVTLSPYLGEDSIHPFRAPGKGVFVVCSTSNPTAAELQDAALARQPLYAHVARRALVWLQDREPGLVVGAVRPEPVRLIREVAPEAWLLMPGLGAQGGSPEVIRAGLSAGGFGVIAPVSRGIHAAPSPAAAARALAAELNGIRGRRARPAERA